MNRAQQILGWSAVATLLGIATCWPRPAESHARAPLARLLGPLAGIVSTVQWTRSGEAARAGRSDLALARGRSALALDPSETRGWMQLAWHLAFERGASGAQADPHDRLNWVRAGLDLAQQGEAVARAPAELALWQGLVYARLAREEPVPPWPGGAAELWRLAQAAFERAARLGHPHGDELAQAARRARGR